METYTNKNLKRTKKATSTVNQLCTWNDEPVEKNELKNSLVSTNSKSLTNHDN